MKVLSGILILLLLNCTANYTHNSELPDITDNDQQQIIDSENPSMTDATTTNNHKDSLGRYYRQWSTDQKRLIHCPFPEFYKWINGNCIRHGFQLQDEFEIAGHALIFIVVLFANVSGLSGGFLTVIILYEIFGFESRKTFGYAAFMNLWAVILRYIVYFKYRNPNKSFQTLIDYEMVIILLPCGIFGTIWGSLIYNVFPMFIIAIFVGVFWLIISTLL